jgi:hypothetical protein
MTIERSTEMTYSPKTSKARRIAAAVSVLLGLPLCMTAHAQEPPKAVMETPMLDPWVPPGTIKKSTVAVPTQGASLAEQVERKLKAGFDAADVARTGTLTRAQAEAGRAGLHREELRRDRPQQDRQCALRRREGVPRRTQCEAEVSGLFERYRL